MRGGGARSSRSPCPSRRTRAGSSRASSSFDLERLPRGRRREPTEPRPRDEPVVAGDRQVEPPGAGVIAGVIVSHARGATEHPELVEPHLGVAGARPRQVLGAEHARAGEEGAFVYVPARRARRRADRPVGDSGDGRHGDALALADRRRAGRRGDRRRSSTCPARTTSTAYFNPVTELFVGEGAKLEYLCVQDLSERSWILGSQRAQVGARRVAALGRPRLRLRPGQAADGDRPHRAAAPTARVTGAYVGHGRQHIDYDTTQEHAAPDTTSDLAFRGILRDRATAVWSGMIRVDPDAQRTDAFQESRNLLLSDGAHADAIPGLEIEANDVRCTHAATVSKIDEEPALLPDEPRARRARTPSGCWWAASSR